MNRRFTTALAAVAGALLIGAPSAFGAPVTKTLSFPLSGSSTTNIFSQSFSCCHISFSVDPFGSFDGSISGGISLDMATSMSAPSHNDLTFTDTNLRQGRHLDLTNTYTNDSASFNANYTLSGSLDVYGLHFDYSKSAGDTMTCGLPLPTDTCSHTTNVTLFSFTPLDVGVAYFQVNVLAPITTTANINGDGVTSHRTMTVLAADALTPADLNFTSSPQVKDEGALLSCSLPVNEAVNYAMGDASSHVNGNVTEGVGIGVSGSVFLRDPIFGDHDIFDLGPITFGPLFSLPGVTFNTINLTAPGKNIDLGNLLPNNIAPTVAMDTIPSDGTEGSPIQLSVKGTGPGGSLSPCGDSSLDIHWLFDDGGSAYGKTVNHAWADNFLGSPSPPHTGEVVITDPTGLKTTVTFSVPVANVAPVVTAGPSKTTYWGVPVSFHANGSDAGPVDNGSLLYSWDFGDPDSPIGGVGQDVSHTYSMPGLRTAIVTVTDNDGATGTSSVAVNVIKRGSTTGYSGATTFVVTDAGTFRAALSDNLSAGPVAGRTVNFYDGSTLIASGITDNGGVATASYTFALGSVGAHTITAKFAGDGLYTPSDSGGTLVTVTRNTSVLTYTGVLTSSPSKAVTLTAKLTDDLGRPLSGKTVSFTLGVQGCTGITTANGTVSCTIAKLQQKPGQYAFALQYAGDADYTAAAVNAVFLIGH
jgi:hypothetical protein